MKGHGKNQLMESEDTLELEEFNSIRYITDVKNRRMTKKLPVK
jgi:hypothetical protein